MPQRVSGEIEKLILQAVEQTSEAILITDAGGRIIYANRAFEETSGYDSDYLLGKKPSVMKNDGAHSPSFYKELWGTITAGRKWHGRMFNRHKNGAVYTMDTDITPVRDKDGAVTHFISVRRDITRELQLEKQLVESQKLESLGLLAGQISHDFNNMLTIIIGSVELVLEDTKEGTINHKLLAETLKTARHTAELTKQLLVFARRQETRPKRSCANDLIKEAELILKRLMPKNIDFLMDLETGLWDADLEATQFQQVLINLSINAQDAMPGGGAMKLSTRNITSGDDSPWPIPPGDYVLVQLEDTGTGIPQEILDKVFDPFFTTKAKGKGTGLGLSIVYGIVKQHGGEILVDSVPGKGTTFRLFFPRVK
ncbi:MAG: ATP-binding protein [Elusimicrobiales bacterium]|nr:ATP-binding protein [Elusimicrobiales bacterium]